MAAVERLMKRQRVDGDVGVSNKTVSIPVGDVDEFVLWDTFVAKKVQYKGRRRHSLFCHDQ